MGYSHPDGTEPPHAFRYARGAITDLGTGYGPGGGSAAREVNDRGVVVGTRFERQGAAERAVVWRDGKIIDLGTLGGTTESTYTTGINDRGDIVGASQNTAAQVHATLWRNGAIRDLGTLGGNYSEAKAINEAGQVVGGSRIVTDDYHDSRAFLWQNGTMTDLNTRVPGLPAGVTLYAASDINDNGAIAGFSCPYDCERAVSTTGTRSS